MVRFFLFLCIFPSLIWGVTTLHFGIIVYRSNDASQKEYQPLVDYLNANLEGYKIEMVLLNHDEMMNALRKNQLDFITTNPAYYEIIHNDNLLTRIIATTQKIENGMTTDNLGGVIFTSSANPSIHLIRDLKGKSIAARDRVSLGGYQAQAYESLENGIDLTKETKVSVYPNHDSIINAVLSGKADVGFVRTGILESMIKEKHLKLNDIRIIHQQKMRYFPYMLSTRLYPEWPIAIMPNMNDRVAKQLTLLLLNYSSKEKTPSAINGFTLPQNYQAVTDLVKTLHLPPYDKEVIITYKDIYQQYRNQIIGIIAASALIIIALIQILRLNFQIRSNEERFQLAIEGTSDGLFDWNMTNNEMFHSKNFEKMLGYSGDELPQTLAAWSDIVHPDDKEPTYKSIEKYIQSKGKTPFLATFRMRTKSGDYKWIQGRGKILFDSHYNAIRFIGFNSDITEKKENELKLQHAAQHDYLTNLPNRTLLSDLMPQVLAGTKRHHTHAALLFIDLDGFKNINDTYGHGVGDLLLKEVALRIHTLIRDEDIVARLGGDEFAVLIADLDERDNITYLLSRLLKSISDPYFIHNNEMFVTASIGISFYPQENEIDADTLLRQADQAMYDAKFHGKNQYHYFDEIINNSKKVGNAHLEKIKSAIENNELLLHYQPKVNMHTGEILGAEALVRWNSPSEGILYPDTFLPFIDDRPSMYQLDLWVMEHVFHQISKWKSIGFGNKMRFSINLSAYSFKQKGLLDEIKKMFDTHPDISPTQVEFEILETSALQNIQEVQQIIDALQTIGVTVALDDFGTGYASMAYLKKLNVDYLKVDRSFIVDILNDTGDLRILEATIALAEAFRSSVIAEGVESQAHGDLLIQFGCFLAQGYAIAKPMLPDAFVAWVPQWKPFSSWQKLTPIQNKYFPFLYAAIEHRIWFNDFKSFINGRIDNPPQQDHTLCQFGKWLHSEGKELFADDTQYDELYTLHHQMHEFTVIIIQQVAENDGDLDEKLLDNIHHIHTQLLAFLQKMASSD